MKPIFQLFVFLYQRDRATVLWMLVAGILSGLFSAGLLAVITRALAQPGAAGPLAAAFVALVLGRLFTTLAAEWLIARFTQRTILDLSLDLSRQLLKAPLRTLERHGLGRILTTLTDDVSALTWAVQNIPQMGMNLAVVAGCGAYLAWLSWPMFVTAVLMTLVGALGYEWLHTRAFDIIHASRRARTRLFDAFRELTLGAKELMLSRVRRESFLHHDIEAAADDYRRTNQSATLHYAIADGWTQTLFYALIGVLLFALPAWSNAAWRPDTATLTAYVLAMLFMLGPIWSVIGAIPTLTRGKVALEQIQDLGISLAQPFTDHALLDNSTPNIASATDGIRLRQAVFSYDIDAEHESAFRLGPLDFDLRPGELVFVVGGNGSGKSTFLKVLTGLYPLQAGQLQFNGRSIDALQLNTYREQFAAVFADFHLFRRLHGVALPERALGYLQRLQIDHKVSLSEGVFSTLDLSQGQRKRLALVVAYLEDRPYYVFDEWAADQDPEYKAWFYATLLPELRAAGKGVLVVTHDDRYFSAGDRVIKLENGQIVSLEPHVG